MRDLFRGAQFSIARSLVRSISRADFPPAQPRCAVAPAIAAMTRSGSSLAQPRIATGRKTSKREQSPGGFAYPELSNLLPPCEDFPGCASRRSLARPCRPYTPLPSSYVGRVGSKHIGDEGIRVHLDAHLAGYFLAGSLPVSTCIHLPDRFDLEARRKRIAS